MNTIEFNMKKFDAVTKGGIDLVFSTELTQKEANQLNWFFGGILLTDNTKETPTQYYLSDTDLSDDDLQKCINILPSHAKTFELVFNKDLPFNTAPIDVYYAFTMDDDEDDPCWDMTVIRKDIYDKDECLLTGFNRRLYDYLMGRGFDGYGDSVYEHELMYEGNEHAQIVLTTLRSETHYNFIEKKELVDDES